MVTKRISELPALTTPSTSALLVAVEGAATQKVTLENLFNVFQIRKDRPVLDLVDTDTTLSNTESAAVIQVKTNDTDGAVNALAAAIEFLGDSTAGQVAIELRNGTLNALTTRLRVDADGRVEVFRPFQFGPFTVATLPDASAHVGGVISVTDGNNGGPCLARSNGTDWLRVELGQAVSTAAPEAPTLTIASGAVTVTPGIYVFRLDTEGAGASDDLTSINGMVPGRIYTFTSVDSARVIVMKNSVGNLELAGADFTIDLSLSMIQLMVVGGAAGTGARELSRSTNTIT